MTDYNNLVKTLQTIFDDLADKIKPIKGFLGDGRGNVAVPNRPDYSYARFDQASATYFEIFNKNAPTINNWPVLIGEIPWQPGLTQTISTDWDSYIAGGWGEGTAGLSLHAPTHEWADQRRGVDALNVYLRSIAPFRTYAVQNELTSVYVNAMEYYTGSVWGGTPGIDLSPIINTLSTGTALFAGVYLDTDNTLSVVTGTTSVDTPAFDPPRVTFPWSGIPSARVRLYGGQTQILETDIRDARRLWDFPPTGTGGGGGGNLENTIDAKGDLLVGTADNTAARLAVGSNDQVLTADSGEATGLKWAAGGAGLGTLTITDKTSDYTITAAECNGTTVFTNSGASGTVKFTLPTASAGLNFWVVVVAAQDIQLEGASASEKIYCDGEQSGTQTIAQDVGGEGGYTRYYAFQVICLSSTIWIVEDPERNWTAV